LTFNNSNTYPFNYDYNATNVMQPTLRDAVLEVAVWSGETGLDTSAVLFFDDFDAATAPAGWASSGIVERFGGTPKYGLASIQLRDTQSNITRTISTTGYSAITVSFDMGTQMSGPVFLNAEWSPDGGTTWNLMKQINSGDIEDDNSLHPFSYSLPANADNNSVFTIRFGLGGALNPGDKGFIDNVMVGGIPN
jgi:hypothetical protein